MENSSSFIRKFGLILASGSLVLCSFSSVVQQGQQSPGTITITLRVDTDNVNNKNLDQTCHFDGQPEGVSNEAFTIEANVGDVIVWQGVSSTSASDVVEITNITHDGSNGGKNIFGKDLLPEGTSRKVTSRITQSSGEAGYKYKIAFKVTNKGKRSGTLHIDPVIQAH